MDRPPAPLDRQAPHQAPRLVVPLATSPAAALLLAALLGPLGAAPAGAAPELARLVGYAPGTVVVRQSERRLYLQLPGGVALRYPVAVGMAGKGWRGVERVDGKHVDPAWSPPREVKRDNPSLPDVIAGGAPNNPMGPRALTLTGGEYAIHGTNRPSSIGRAASYGCVRMLNADVVDLFDRVALGAAVVMLP